MGSSKSQLLWASVSSSVKEGTLSTALREAEPSCEASVSEPLPAQEVVLSSWPRTLIREGASPLLFLTPCAHGHSLRGPGQAPSTV